MSGSVVNCTSQDSVRIKVLDEGRTVQVPATVLLAVDRVFRSALASNCGLGISWIGENAWSAQEYKSAKIGYGATPWAAIVALAGKLAESPREGRK